MNHDYVQNLCLVCHVVPLSNSLARVSIRVNATGPGDFKSGMNQAFFNRDQDYSYVRAVAPVHWSGPSLLTSDVGAFMSDNVLATEGGHRTCSS